MKVVGIIQARMGSTRLPQKVLMEVNGEPLLGRIIMRLKAVGSLDAIIVATSTDPADKAIVDLAGRYGVESFLGSENDVLARFVGAVEHLEVETILRATGDNPLVDPGITQEIISRHIEYSSDYTVMEGLPLGVTPEVVSKKALLLADSILDKKSPHREHVTSFIRERHDLFNTQIIKAPTHLSRPSWRLTVDTREDLRLIREIFGRLDKQEGMFTILDVVRLLDANSQFLQMNAHIKQRVMDES